MSTCPDATPSEGRRITSACTSGELQAHNFSHWVVDTHMSEVRLLYLIGELYRRLGKEKQAIIYFSRVIARKKETIEKGIVNMAYDRWQEIREEKKGAQ